MERHCRTAPGARWTWTPPPATLAATVGSSSRRFHDVEPAAVVLQAQLEAPQMTTPAPRTYEVHARSTDVFGRVLCNARDQHIVVDGPVQNGCPGEAVTPAELFLSGVAACGVELVGVLARAQSMPLSAVRVDIRGMQDPAHPVRQDVNLFNAVHLDFTLSGVTEAQGEELIAAFKRR
ncbi:MAG: OsmC family protein [Ktedonobacterales bacterium]